MTTVDDVEMTCSVCKKTSNHYLMLSSNQFGYQDMDFRPSEMYRSTMHMWVLECPHCGYVANRLEDKLEINPDFIQSDKYVTCDGIDFKSDLSRIFYRSYLIECEKKDDESAFFSALYCAWSCDDAKDTVNSKYLRQLAIGKIDTITESGMEGFEKIIVIKSDLLRRIGEFDRLLEEYENLVIGDELLDGIISFEVEKARLRDDKWYTMEELEK